MSGRAIESDHPCVTAEIEADVAVATGIGFRVLERDLAVVLITRRHHQSATLK
jgi:hypothetical protein